MVVVVVVVVVVVLVLVPGGSDVAVIVVVSVIVAVVVVVVIVVSDGGWGEGVSTYLFFPSSFPFSSTLSLSSSPLVAFGESLVGVVARAAVVTAAAPWSWL